MTHLVPIKVQVFFQKIGDINTKQQVFETQVELILKWSLPTFDFENLPPTVWNEKKVNQWLVLNEDELKEFDEIIPQVVIINLEDSKKEHQMYIFEKQESNYLITMKWLVKGNFYEQMELYDFPFDVQDLCIRLDLKERCKEKFKLQSELIPGFLNDKSFQDEQEWDLFKMVQTGENNADNDEDVLVMRCNVKRKFRYFLYNCFLVMLFFAIMSLCNFANRPANVQFRLAGTLTLVLTSVAYKLMLSNSLPTISYLTLVDVYVLFSVFMLTFLVVAFAVLHVIYRWMEKHYDVNDREDTAWLMDIGVITGLACFHLIWNVGFGFYSYQRTKSVTEKLREQEVTYRQNLEEALERVSKGIESRNSEKESRNIFNAKYLPDTNETAI